MLKKEKSDNNLNNKKSNIQKQCIIIDHSLDNKATSTSNSKC